MNKIGDTSDRICLLPDNVIDLIAAGEVVQRPSTALKELIENALDAGAKHVKVVFEDGGKTLLQVIDDGVGMTERDAVMCVQRHATSKVKDKHDLQHISSYGFRGEALNAISAVADMEILTRTSLQDIGTRLAVEASKIKIKEAIAIPIGTQITVRYLFGNVPARRHFLKSHAIEGKHIIDVFQQMALARPDVAFTLYQNKSEIYRLPTSKLSHRIVDLFGRHYQKQLIPCEEQVGDMLVEGYTGTPNQAKKTRGGQFFFVNKRYIKSPYLHHAVKKAFENLIAEDRFPFYVLFLSIPLDQVDINVHPNKIEVRFQEEKLLYALVATSLRKALATHHCMHTIDFEQTDTKALFTTDADAAIHTQPVDLSGHQREIEQLPIATDVSTVDIKPLVPETSKLEDIIATNKELLKQGAQQEEKSRTAEVLPGKLQLHRKYILAQVKSGLMMIHQRRAYERILYEQYKRSMHVSDGHSQKLLFGYKVRLQPADLTLFKSCLDILYRLGFRCKVYQDEVTVVGHPLSLLRDQSTGEHMITGLLEQYKTHMEVTLDESERWVRALTRRNNLPEYADLRPEEMDSIVDRLFSCQCPNYTLDGERIWYIVPVERLEGLLL